MTEIYVLNRDFRMIGIIDSYVSVIWRPSYSDIGDFEIYMGATDHAIELLQENTYLVRSQDIHVDDSGNVTYKKVMIVKNAIIDTNVENGDFLTVTGRELKFILHQRLIWKQTIVNGTAENAIRKYVDENAITTAAERVIPTLTLAEPLGLTDTISKQVTAEPLDETIVEVCNAYGYGWEIYIYNNKLIFTLTLGVNRSYSQTDRTYVIFSDEFNNIYSTEYQKHTESFANTALIGGEGEGLERIYTTYGNENTGFDRFETFVDANGIRRNEGSEDEIKLSEYEVLLKEKGKETLSSLAVTEAFTGEVVDDIGFIYEQDYFLGDVVTVTNKYGVSKDVRVISAIESEDETGTKLIPQFNI